MEIHFPRMDGKQASGFLAMPEDGEQSPSLVLIHEWWGVNEQIKRTAARFAEEGFRVLVPDLFDGRVAKDAAEAAQLSTALDQRDAVENTVRGAVKHLEERTPGTRCGIVGFCMGGAITIAAAVHVRELDAAVCFYGIPDMAVADPRLVRIPLQCHFATEDDWCTPQRVGELERALEQGGVNHEIYRYKAKHAFMNEARPEVHDPVAARQAWDRALTFLESTVGGHVARTAST